MVNTVIPQVGTNEQEVWKPIPGVPGYEASSLGRIRSLDRIVRNGGRGIGPFTRMAPGRLATLIHKVNKDGTVYYTFRGPGEVTLRVNRMVCLTFNGPPPSPKYHAAHNDGNSTNNVPTNLTWKTAIENAADKKLHGTHQRKVLNQIGSKSPISRLCEDDIPEIFKAYLAGELTDGIGSRLGVSSGLIATVLRRKTWTHVAVDDLDIARAAEINAKRRAYNLSLGPPSPKPRKAGR